MNESIEDDICARNHGGNELSKEANRKVNKVQARTTIFHYIQNHVDLTCDEVEILSGYLNQTCSARFSELKRAGLVLPTVRRKTRSGSWAQAWKAAPLSENEIALRLNRKG